MGRALGDTAGGFVVHGSERLRFAELAEAAADEDLPDILLMRGGVDNRLAGQPLPRIDVPSKIDGSARFAGDVRLPEMLFASVRSAPPGGRLLRFDRDAPKRVPGAVRMFDSPEWVAALGTSWWAADRALRAMAPAGDGAGVAKRCRSKHGRHQGGSRRGART
jgi:isoquinoline 1-oxidoreductase subunit beta